MRLSTGQTFFFSSRRRHTRCSRDWSSDVCSSDLRREGPQLADPAAVTPEEGASSRELARQLEAAVGELPPKQRAALLLSRVDGLAYRDVAEALGCTEGAVKALLFRATQSLKKTLREYL